MMSRRLMAPVIASALALGTVIGAAGTILAHPVTSDPDMASMMAGHMSDPAMASMMADHMYAAGMASMHSNMPMTPDASPVPATTGVPSGRGEHEDHHALASPAVR